jgi:hypothetical protein
LNIARQFIDHHMKKFELTKINVQFLEGEIDQLDKTELEENSIDLVV